MRRFAPALVGLLLGLACGGDDSAPPLDGDGGSPDAGEDAPDAGPPSCPAGMHVCGTGCVMDQDNLPERGCRLGCGEPCPQPSGTLAGCDADGTCTLDCEPPAVMGPDGSCDCDATTCEDVGAVCGEIDDGCGGTVACGACAGGAACMDGACECPLDAAEPNETSTTPTDAPTLTDEPDTDMSFDTWSLSSAGDVDWFRFPVTDAFDIGNPVITVELDAIPAGSDYDLGAWYVCGIGSDATTCSTGTMDSTLGEGCISELGGLLPETVVLETDCSSITSTDDSGHLFVRVRATEWSGSCEPYRIRVRVR